MKLGSQQATPKQCSGVGVGVIRPGTIVWKGYAGGERKMRDEE